MLVAVVSLFVLRFPTDAEVVAADAVIATDAVSLETAAVLVLALFELALIVLPIYEFALIVQVYAGKGLKQVLKLPVISL